MTLALCHAFAKASACGRGRTAAAVGLIRLLQQSERLREACNARRRV